MSNAEVIQKCEQAIVAVELSNIDAHKKANIKAILFAVAETCSKCPKECDKEQCKFYQLVEKHIR